MTKFRNISKRQKVIGVVLLLILLLVVVISLSGNNKVDLSHNKALTSEADKTITAKMILENPQDYKGKVVEITGKVFNTDKKGDTNAWQVWTDPEKSEGNIIIYYSGSSDIGNDNYIKIKGEVDKVIKGSNAFNANLEVPSIKASAVTKINRDEAAAPAIKTVSPNQSQTQEGLTITLQKIEYAASETRLFLQVNNSSSGTLNFYSFDVKMVQGDSQVKSKNVYPGEGDIPSELVAGTKEPGKLYFEKADPSKPINITYQAFSSVSYHDLNFTFTVLP